MAEMRSLITAEQFLRMSFEDERVELSDGALLRRPLGGFQLGLVTASVAAILYRFVVTRQLGAVILAAGYKLGEHTVRIPAVSFVSKERLGAVGRPTGFWPGAPDLAVEGVSPGDCASDLQKKIGGYFHAGTRMVWVFYPPYKAIHVSRNPKEIRVLEAQDVLSGEDVLPGFSVPVEEFFK